MSKQDYTLLLRSEKRNGDTVEKISYSDEYYTPRWAVDVIKKYIPKDFIVWMPFDTEQSHFYKAFTDDGYTVVKSHVATGQNFFEYEPDKYDVIVSNPPYSLKTEILERLQKLKKPFALLINIVGMYDNFKRFKIFSEIQDTGLIIPQGRINYFTDYADENGTTKRVPFQSMYITGGFSSFIKDYKQIIFEARKEEKKKENKEVIKEGEK